MPTPSPADLRAFVRRATRFREVPDVPGVRLHLADDVAAVGGQVARIAGGGDVGIPYWAFAWAGGLAVARYVLEHPELVAGRRVVDLGSGSGLCAIVAKRAGAATVRAYDVDPFSEAAVAVNARANGVRIGFVRGDPLEGPPPARDVVLAGDVCYEERMADRMMAWLEMAAEDGSDVLLGDPGRRYLPASLARLASYRVRTTRELEPSEVVEAGVFALGSTAPFGPQAP